MQTYVSSWLERVSSWTAKPLTSHRVHLAATAVLSGGAVATLILSYQASQRRRDITRLKMAIPETPKPLGDRINLNNLLSQGHSPNNQIAINDNTVPDTSRDDARSAALAARAREGDYDNELILEQLARNRVFLSDDGLQKLRAAFVVIVGCGGVGSHAAAALARSGVTRIRLIDFDQVTLSSLNRHSVATLADVGTPKVLCLKKRLEQITPWVHFDCKNELFGERVADTQLGPWLTDSQIPSYVVDAIDNIDSKVELLHFCYSKKIPVVSSMGAGCKSDPTRVFVGDISTSTDDPLSRSTRRLLKKLGVHSGIPVVFSTEKMDLPGKASLLPLPEDEFAKGQVGDLAPMANFRARILPVLGTMPAVFGLVVANHVILSQTGYPHEYMQAKYREKMYDGMLSALAGLEQKLARANGEEGLGLRVPLTVDDIAYLVEEVYRGRSAVSGLPTRLALVRWQKPAAGPEGQAGQYVDTTYGEGQRKARLSLNELVCMTKEEAQLHESRVLRDNESLESVYSDDVLQLVRRRREEEQQYAKFR